MELTEEQIKEIVKAAVLVGQELEGGERLEDAINMTASSGTNDLEFDRVKSGRKLVIHHLSGYDDTSAPTRIRVGYNNGARNCWLKTVPAPLVTETVAFNGEVVLGEGMYPIVRIEGATSGDDIYATLNCHWVKL